MFSKLLKICKIYVLFFQSCTLKSEKKAYRNKKHKVWKRLDLWRDERAEDKRREGVEEYK